MNDVHPHVANIQQYTTIIHLIVGLLYWHKLCNEVPPTTDQVRLLVSSWLQPWETLIDVGYQWATSCSGETIHGPVWSMHPSYWINLLWEVDPGQKLGQSSCCPVTDPVWVKFSYSHTLTNHHYPEVMILKNMGKQNNFPWLSSFSIWNIQVLRNVIFLEIGHSTPS